MRRNLKAHLKALRHTKELSFERAPRITGPGQAATKLFPEEGREEETPFGRCYMRETAFPLSYQHGKSKLGGLLHCQGRGLTLPARDEALAAFNPSQALFFDIETTGLSGGTGTLAFLIGLGWLEEDHFLLRQYFLREIAEERSLLSHFSLAAEKFSTLVTFNGKLFDLPLVQSRLTLSGLKEFTPPLHLDLLPCARTLWRNRLSSRSLSSLEKNILGVHRVDDLPGAQIPSVYFDYLREGNTALLRQVFEHNVLDILSMVTLLEKISFLGAGEKLEHPAEKLALGHLYLGAGETARGLGLLNQVAKDSKGPLAAKATLDLALFYKRQGQWHRAVSLWETLGADTGKALQALAELAKYYEHQSKDLKKALKLTEKALFYIKSGFCLPSSQETSLEAFKHRHKRLKRRLAKAENLP